MTELTFQDLRADDEPGLRVWFDLREAVRRADRPDDPALGWALHVGMVRHPWPGYEPHRALAMLDGTAVGWFGCTLTTAENVDAAPTELEVHPDHRHRGIGQAVLAEASRRMVDGGRTRIIAEAVTDGPSAAFAIAAGARAVLVDTQRRLDLATVDEARLDALLADSEAHAAGYSLLQWSGRTPDEHLDEMAALESRMTTDAPLDDLRWEQEVFDADRMRARDEVMAARLNRPYTSAVRDDASRQVVGSTTLVVADGVDDCAGQWQTIVLPEHRGHRLGMLLKVANLRFLRKHEPAVTSVDTWNADSNAPMLRVNVAMGFQPVRHWAEWELLL
jgi:GNAT superfamily N-acetyltransferase